MAALGALLLLLLFFWIVWQIWGKWFFYIPPSQEMLETRAREQEALQNRAPAPSFLQQVVEGARNRRRQQKVQIIEEQEESVLALPEVQARPQEMEVFPTELKIEDLELHPGDYLDLIQVQLQYLYYIGQQHKWFLARDKVVPGSLNQKWWDYLVGSGDPTAKKPPGVLRRVGALTQENRLILGRKEALIAILERHEKLHGENAKIKRFREALRASMAEKTEPEQEEATEQIEEDESSEDDDKTGEDD